MGKHSIELDQALELVDTLVNQHTGQHLSGVQVAIFKEAWIGSRKTYRELAHETQYSASYLQQGVAPKLWRLLSKITGEKITKGTLKTILCQFLSKTFSAQEINLEGISIHTFPNHNDNYVVPSDVMLPPLTDETQTIHQYETTDTSQHILVSSQLKQCPDSSAVEHSNPKVNNNFELFPEESVALDSPLYIERGEIDRRCKQEISVPSCLIRIKASRQMGKSSLLNRIIHHAQTLGYRTALLHLQQAESAILSDTNRLLRWICANIAAEINLFTNLDQYWDEDLGSKMSCNFFMQSYILKHCEEPLVIAFEEVNELLEYPVIAQEFLTLLRFWHERSKLDEQWRSLRLIMVHSTEIYVSLDVNQSPLNVGLSINLRPFDHGQVQQLAQRHQLALSAEYIDQIQHLLGGHPYLTRLTFYYLTKRHCPLDSILAAAATDTGIYHHHLHRHLGYLNQYPNLKATFCDILADDSAIVINQVDGFKLQSLGLIRLDQNKAKIACQLYQDYFSDRLLDCFNKI